jgi:anion-transporting  ArsA/GET3 family ATPase
LVRDQTDWMLDILNDPVRTGLVMVTTPEEMPVTETIELVEKVRSTTDVDVAAIIANRVLPQWFSAKDEKVFRSLLEPSALARIVAAVGPKVTTVFAAASLAQARREVAVSNLGRLRDGVPAEVPLLLVPELFTRAGGRRVVSLLADALHDELGGIVGKERH